MVSGLRPLFKQEGFSNCLPRDTIYGEMRIGYIQTDPKFGAVTDNLTHVEALISGDQADLWVLPELFATGYQFRSKQEAAGLSEPIPEGVTSRFLADLAARRNCYIAAGLAEKGKDGSLYNAAILVGPDGFISCYRKVHLFYKEKLWFSPGDKPFPVIDIGMAKVGMMICFDHLFPEAARTLGLAGAEVIVHPANLVIPEYGQLTMRVRAIENGVFTVTANRIGIEKRDGETLRFTGESQIVSPNGEVLVKGAHDREEVRVVEIDSRKARDKSLNPYNDRFADRRPELYRI